MTTPSAVQPVPPATAPGRARRRPASHRPAGRALVVALALGLAACAAPAPAVDGAASAPAAPVAAGGPTPGGVLRQASADPGSAIDPVTVSSPGGTGVVDTVAEKLVRIDRSNQVQPLLATEWSVGEDNLTWTFVIRQQVKFNNGATLTPADVVATFERLIAPDSVSPAKNSLAALAQVRANGDQAVDFVLSKPFSDFPYLLAGSNTQILPADYQLGSWDESFVGTGAFLVESFNPGQGVTFTRNPDYWNADHVYLDAVELKFFKDQQAQVLALQSGEIDGLLGEPVAPALTSALDRSQYTVRVTESASFVAFAFRTDQPPFDQVKTRQAVAWALDRPAIIATALGGQAQLGNDNIYAPLFPVRPTGLEQRAADYDQVRELLDGQVVTFTITTSPSQETLATLIQQQLTASGSFKVDLEILSDDAYFADGPDSPWLNAQASLTGWAGRATPSQYIDLIYRTGSGWNASKYSNPRLDELADQYDATTDLAQRQALVEQLAEIQWTDVPLLVFAFRSYTSFLNPKVHLPEDCNGYTDLWIEA
jgi:peptide/nickel transport system substrate-binding protein